MRTSFLKILALLGVISLPLSSCEEMDAIQLDKKIILTILDDHYGYGSGFETTIYSSSLIGFDKNDYINIESISFVVSDLQTQKTTDGSDIIASISVELFDLTNDPFIKI